MAGNAKTDAPAPSARAGRAALAESTRADIVEVATAEFVDKGLAGAWIDVMADKTHRRSG